MITAIPISVPRKATDLSVAPAKIPSLGSLGLRSITFGSPFSIPKAMAGIESFTKLINNN